MKKVKLLDWFLNEGLSLSEIKKIIKTKEYKEVARALQDVREVSDIWNMLDPKMFEFTEDEFEDIFYDWWGDQGYDSLREFSTGGSTEDTISLYKHLLPYLVESVVTEKFSFSKKEVEAAASLIASAISKADRVKTEVHHLEYDKGRGAGFDISIDDEESAGGSYVVRDNGDVVNVAISNSQPNAVYSTIGNKDIDDVFTNMKKYESVINEWGSSDQSTFNKSIHKDIGSPKKMPSPFDDKLRAAAEDAVDFYWDEWPEYQTNRDGLIDDAVRGYLRKYFKEDFQMMQKMFASKNNEEVVEVTEAKFVKDFDKDVLDAEYKADITNYYPSAKFFMGKSTHFFGELEPNLFFKAYYKDYVKSAGGKIEGDFKIVMIYSEKGSNYVPLFTREAGSK